MSHNVINGGPLWSQSMFAFECKMGDFKKCQRSKVCITESIAKKYCLKESKGSKPTVDEKVVMLRGRKIDVGLSCASIFREFGLLPLNSGQYEISHEARIRNEVFKSICSNITKSIDYFIEMTDQTIGVIELFVKHQENVYVLVKKYEIVHEKFHLNDVEIKLPVERQLYSCDDIDEKLIYLKFGRIEVVTSEPNKFEKT